MEVNIKSISEVYRKYLVQIRFLDNLCYTVLGSDISDDEETDMLLVNEQNQWVLFRNIADLFAVLAEGEIGFDKENMAKWVTELEFVEKDCYASFDLDTLCMDYDSFIQHENWREACLVLGFVRDFALQVNDTGLTPLLDSNVVFVFLDDISEIDLWDTGKQFEPSLVSDDLLEKLISLHGLLKERVRIC
ncbi:hypothetical protein HNQ91_002522 [Filimonas zeae]|uniref:Uncharacterized protein n=1 Tax=Filimonas zeae TaxID=1737353 RepID=A0A917IUM3_9BACT|nr:hypothetical protein [Filimonas zeae]MDR6339471.1 hypothetical protein [Filimonas zeae]GGH63465.1 hypothetical protein GCM10011379_14390 [Filimonas zeae]